MDLWIGQVIQYKYNCVYCFSEELSNVYITKKHIGFYGYIDNKGFIQQAVFQKQTNSEYE